MTATLQPGKLRRYPRTIKDRPSRQATALKWYYWSSNRFLRKIPMRISMRVGIAPTLVLTGWFAWVNPFRRFIT